jgi:hypothetical protein
MGVPMTLSLPNLSSVFHTNKNPKTNINTILDKYFHSSDHSFPYSLLSEEKQIFCPNLDISETNAHY